MRRLSSLGNNHSKDGPPKTRPNICPAKRPAELANIANVLLGLVVLASFAARAHTTTAEYYAGPYAMASQILRARGYHAQDHYITTRDNYRLLLTRGLNPLIERGRRGQRDRLPILFIHGILESLSVFVVNSRHVRPKDFSRVNLAALSLDEARERYGEEPSAKALPMLALDHGHEVWLLSRRGFAQSRTKAGPSPVEDVTGAGLERTPPPRGPTSAFLREVTDFNNISGKVLFSFNRQFWNFSLDEQAQFDVPAAIDFILAETGHRQLSVVGHSAGGSMTFMALASQPELNQKINSAILWSSPLALGHGGDLLSWLHRLRPLFEWFDGAFPPSFSGGLVQAVASLICSSKWGRRYIYGPYLDTIAGFSGDQAPILPEFVGTLHGSSSTHELAHLMQNFRKASFQRYDHGLEGNLAQYGQPRPGAYDLSRIKVSGLSLYVGATDFLVSPADMARTSQLIKVAHKFSEVRAPFNHLSYFFHADTARLVVIPSLRDIHQFQQQTAF